MTCVNFVKRALFLIESKDKKKYEGLTFQELKNKLAFNVLDRVSFKSLEARS